MEIDTNLFPIPESHYSRSGLLARHLPLSVFALNLHITTSPGSLLPNEKRKGHFMFRNELVPLPRPCTVLAWNRIVALGRHESPVFLIPFLPSLRDDDETGQAISERGSKIHSLSRRSQIHVRDSDGRISWGSVYIGEVKENANEESILIGATSRSNIVESLITPRPYVARDSAQESIRARMEFLASYGLPAIFATGNEAGLPIAKRILFQFLSQRAAAEWGLCYSRTLLQVLRDPGLIDADYKDFIFLLKESRTTKAASDSTDSDLTGKGNKIPASARFGDINSADLF